MMNSGDQAGSRGTEDSGKGQTDCQWAGMARERWMGKEAVCAHWRSQEPAPGICAGGSILPGHVDKGEDFNKSF